MPEVKAEDDNAWFLSEDDVAVVYMDAIDWQHHTLEDGRGTRVFPTESHVLQHRGCSVECGIVEVEIRFRRWAVPQNLHGKGAK